MSLRFRRQRRSASLRELLRETRISPADLIQPFFVVEGQSKRQPIGSMPGIFRFSGDQLLKEVELYVRGGGKAVILFGVSSQKDQTGKFALSAKSPVPQAIKAIKGRFPELVVISDVCLCAYMTHGHCGIVRQGQIDNDATVAVLSQMAALHAHAGVDIVAPSDMMDLRVQAIRKRLDQEGLLDTSILSYAVKYASAFYGPFREAAASAPQFGDRKTYQMDPGNSREALKEARQDVAEGADMVMVKPALGYLDIVNMLRRELNVPVAAYQVSGEYSMIKAAAQNGWVDEKAMVLESMLCIKRAGADLIMTYYAQDILKWKGAA